MHIPGLGRRESSDVYLQDQIEEPGNNDPRSQVVVNVPDTRRSNPLGRRGMLIGTAAAGLAVTALALKSGILPEGGRERNADLDVGPTLISEITLESDLIVGDLTASNNSTLEGRSSTCLPIVGWCVPDTWYDVSLHNTGTVSLVLQSGTELRAYQEGDNPIYVAVDIEEDSLQSRLYDAESVPNDNGNHTRGLEVFFGDSDTPAALQSATTTNGKDSLQSTITEALEDRPHVVAAILAQGLRTQADSSSGMLSTLETNGDELLEQIAQDDTVYYMDHQGTALNIEMDHEREYQPGETVEINGVEVRFGEDPSEVAFDEDSSTLMGELANDDSVVVLNEPAVPNPANIPEPLQPVPSVSLPFRDEEN